MKKQFTLIAWITLIMTLMLSSCQRFEGDAIQKLAYGKDESGRHFVDLGLSVKWATCNIGAETPEQQGLLYAWGETAPKEEYTWDNYKFGPDTALSKYCAKPDVAWHGFTDAKTTLELSDDAAHVNWRGRWRMPTQSEWNELIEKCTWTQTEYMGVKGYDVKASNGNRIFLPAPDENALYASSSLIETRPGEALHLPIFDQYDVLTAQYRYRAYSVRGVYGSVLPVYCLVNFDANGGEGIMHPQQFSKGALIPLTEVRFTKQASVFSSWNTKADGSGTSYKDKASIITDKSFTIYAQWTPCYTITFDANGGEGTMDSLTIVSGTKKPLPANTFTRSGYVFAGWNTAPDGSGTAYKESSEIAPTEDLTLYAQWTPCYTITFDANGGEGTMDSLQIVQGEETELPANTFTRDGYVFAGWNTAPDGSGISYKEFSEIEPTQNMTLYAQWTQRIFYRVTFNANGGNGTMADQVFEAGVSQTLVSNTFIRSGYTFIGWNTAPDGSGTSYTDRQVVILTEDITLYAQWMECKVESAQINTSAAGIVEGGSELSAGTILAETSSIVMTVGAVDYYKLASAVVNDMTRAIVGGASIDLSIACQGYTNPKDADGGNCDANVTAPASGGFSAFEAKRDGYLYVVCRGMSNKTYLVSEEGILIGYDFAMYTPNAPWGSILRYTLEGEGEYNQIVKGSKAAANLIWPEKIVLGDRWESAAGETSKIAATGVAVIKFPVFAGCRYTVHSCGSKIVSSGFFFVDAETEVVISDDAGNKVVLYETGVSNTNYYNVTFNANGGTGTMSKQGFKEGVSQQLSPNTFTRSGYHFVGWNTAPDGSGTSYTDKQVVSLTEDLTLYAQWEQRFYVSFEANGGHGEMEVQTFTFGEKKALLACSFTYSGFTFIGWNAKADGSGASYSDKQIISVTQDLTLYAQWKRGVYTVSFDANGGSGTMSAQTFEGGVSQALASNSFTRAGYSFINWNTSPDGSGTSYTNMQKIVLSQDITLYAQWKKATYTLTFDANGGEGSMPAQEFEYGVSQSINTNLFTRYGYVFNGWNTKSDGSGQSYIDGETISMDKHLILYAQWKRDASFGEENGYEWVDLGLPSGLKWATCNVGATSPEGYGDYFAWGETAPKLNYDWSTYKYCNGSYSTLTKYNMVDDITTLELSDDAARANWGGTWRTPTKAEQDELQDNCTWTWTTQNGVNGYKVTSKTNGNSIFLPAAGGRSGTSVNDVGSDGYYWSSSLYNSNPYGACYLSFYSGYVDWDGCGGRDNGRTVRAVLLENEVIITFDSNGGTGNMAPQINARGERFALNANTFTRDGYTFVGWNTKADGSGTSYTDMQEISLTRNTTLFAQWKPYHEYYVTFDANGGEGEMEPQLFLYGIRKPLMENSFTREGYVFVEWNREPDGSGTTYQDQELTSLYENITLYAQWAKSTYTLTFDANGGEGNMPAQEFEYGVSQALNANGFTRANYAFIGWNTASNGNGTSYTDQQEITLTQDITLYAQWHELYKITFDSNGGTGSMEPQTFEEGVLQALNANKFTCDGYAFARWNTAADGSGTSYTNQQEIMLTQNITLYAQWKSTTGTENGYEWVDLGLPSGVKWATCNVGATKPEDYGEYFAWGETEPKLDYNWHTYKHCDGTSSTITKYNSADNKIILESSDDAACVNWGGNWRMPTYGEYQELRAHCTWTRVTQNGVEGFKVSSKTNENSIFLPDAGIRQSTSNDAVGYTNAYLSSSVDDRLYRCSKSYEYDDYSGEWIIIERRWGVPVRAVCP